jgi:hypothetical protein
MLDTITSALSRRKMLLGLALSATAATVADAASVPQENPDLLAMADALPAVQAEYLAAQAHVRAIVAEWSPQWPVPSEDIIRYAAGSKDYRDIAGWGLEMPWGKGGLMRMPQLGTPEVFEKGAAFNEKEAARRAGFKSKKGLERHLQWAREDRKRIELARVYWSEVERITAASGIEAAKARREVARDALKAAVDRIMTAEDWTIAGAVIKAQALNAWAVVEHTHRAFNDRGAAWADLLSASIVKHASA